MENHKILLFIPMYNCEKQITRVLGQLTDEVSGFLNELKFHEQSQLETILSR